MLWYIAILRLPLVCGLVLLGTAYVIANAEIDPETTLGCHVRAYTYTVSKPFTTDSGRVLQCWDQVTVDTCWGRCDSSETSDWKLPYRKSNHPVCNYSGQRSRWVTLQHCHPDHPDPQHQVFDAVDCECQPCNAADTSCEHLNG